jgi:hypothetical protein
VPVAHRWIMTIVLVTQMEGACSTQKTFMVKAGPTSYRTAMASEEADIWEAAMSSERTSLGEHNAFEQTENIPGATNVIDGKWVLRFLSLQRWPRCGSVGPLVSPGLPTSVSRVHVFLRLRALCTARYRPRPLFRKATRWNDVLR